MEDLRKALNGLKLSHEHGDAPLTSLDTILGALALKEGAEKQSVIDLAIQSSLLEPMAILLRTSDTHTVTRSAELIAELAKTEVGRKYFTEASIVAPLLELLTNQNDDLVVQACRALGHLCFDNDTARGLVRQLNGVPKVVNLLRHLAEMPGPPPPPLRAVAAGCLLNLTDTLVHEAALQAGILDVVLKYLNRFQDDSEVASHCLLVMASLADSEKGRARLSDPTVLAALISLLAQRPGDILESLLELLGNLAENDGVKYQLAKQGLGDHLLQLLDEFLKGPKERDEQTTSLIKMTCDLIVLLLTGDASMELLYRGSIYQHIIPWLAATNDAELQIAGALAAGNFARKDEHCTAMVEDGIPQALLAVLQDHSGRDGDIRLQHALLAALRNLAIPMANKGPLAELGTVDVLMKMLDVETFPVVFKLLGTLRMLVDRQPKTASKVASEKKLLTRLAHWAETQDHPGVKGESVRLLAWAIQAAKSSGVSVSLLAESGAITPLAAMATAEHALMQDEALSALTILASDPQNLGKLEGGLKQGDLISSLKRLLSTGSTCSPDLMMKAIKLTSLLTPSDLLKEELVAKGLPATLRDLSQSRTVDQATQEAARKLLANFS